MNKAFYDEYWRQASPPPEGDPCTPARKSRLSAALKRLPDQAEVLDLGCGHGEFTAFIARCGFKVTGMDLSSVAVEAARQRHRSLAFRTLTEDGAIPGEDRSFDAVWSSEVLEHVFDVHGHLAEINRVLRPGGLYLLTTPYHGVLKNILISLMKFDRHFDPEVSHIRFFDKRGLARCLGRAGFEPVSWSGIGRIWGLYCTWFVVCEKQSPPQSPPFKG